MANVAPMNTDFAGLFKDDSKCASVDGVLDFVGGASDTALDVGAYDAMKGVDLASARNLFAHLKQLSKGAIGDRLGTVLEIGAGTGLLTLGMLHDGAFDRAVITDISPRMLAVCRARVAEHVPSALAKTVFATYAGGRAVFANEVFDLVIANSVLHHIPDYRAFLADMRSVLKPGGIAFFVEPAACYHDAMSRAMGDALIDSIAKGQTVNRDVRMIATWIADVRFRLCFPEAPELQGLEDKHIFTRAALERAAHDASFSNVSIDPSFIDENGMHGANGYVRELQISPPLAEPFLAAYAKYAPTYFKEVDPSDRSGMYCCIYYR